MDSSTSAAVTAPIDAVDISQESILNQFPQLSATEIKKVLTFSGMSDTGKFEAIISNTDTAGLLAMFGMSYADLKGILALPNDKLTTAPEKIEPLPSPEKIIVIGPEKDLPILADTDASGPAAQASSSPLAPNPAPVDDTAQDVLPDSPCSADLPPVVPVLAPENRKVQGTLPDVPCSVDSGEITPVPLTPVDLPPGSGTSLTLSLAETKNVLTVFGMNDAGTTATLASFSHDDDTEQHAGAGIGADAGDANHDNIPNPDASADAGTDALRNGTGLSIVANNGSVPASGAVHTRTGSEADAQNNSGDLHEDTAQNQNEDNSPLISSELLLGTPPGPSSTPPAEPPVPPLVLPPVPPPELPPVVPPVVPTTEPALPSPVTEPVLPSPVTEPVIPSPVTEPVIPSSVTEPVFPSSVTEPVLPSSVPVAQIPQQGPAVPNELPGSNGGGAQISASNTGSAGGVKSVDEPAVFKSGAGGSSSSSGWGGFGVSSSGGGGGGFSGGGGLDLGSTIVAGGAGSVIVHEVVNGQTGVNFGSGGAGRNGDHQDGQAMPPTTGDTGQPPIQSPTQTPTQAPDIWQRSYDAYQQLNQEFDRITTNAWDLWDERYAVEIRIERARARITTIDSAMQSELQNIYRRPEIAHLTAQNDALRGLVAENQAATAAARREATIAQALAARAQAALRNALATISEIVNQATERDDDQARIDHQTDIVVEQGNILHQQNAIYETQQDRLNKLRNSLRGQEYVIQENTKEINRWQAANHEAMAKWTDGENYIKDLKKYITDNNTRLSQIQTAIAANDALRVEKYAALGHARELVIELSPFRNGRHQDLEDHYGPVDLTDHEPTRDAADMEHDLIGKLPPAPPSYHISEATPEPSDDERDASGTGATHTTTTTGTTGVTGDGQDGDENDADGDSHMGIHTNVNLALAPEEQLTTTPDNAQSPPPADALSTHPNPADQAAITDATHTTTTSGTTSSPTGTGSHPAAGPVSLNVAPDTPASHDLSVQVEMLHPSILAGSSTAVLHADEVVHELPIVHAIIDAWIRTLPSSVQISFQRFDILNADQAGPVTLAIQFAPSSGHTAEANLDLPADAVAILKAAIQGAVASWEQDQESAATIVNDATPNLSAGAPEHPLENPSQIDEHSDNPAVHALTSPVPLASTPAAPAADIAVPLHYGTADMTTPDSVTLAFEFAPPSSTSEFTDFIQHSHDIPALQGVLAHWLDSVDPGFAATVVAFEMFDFDLAGDGGIMLQVLVNNMPVIPDAATLSALQNAMQDYLDRPDSALPDHPANLDGTTHQLLSVVGVAEHSGQV